MIDDGPVAELARALGIEGAVEQLDGEHGPSYCVGRLAQRGLCVNGPLWGLWQYWDVDAQNSAGATEEEATAAALALFERIGVDAGQVAAVEPNGPLLQIQLSGGATVTVAEGGRIAMVIADTALMPS